MVDSMKMVSIVCFRIDAKNSLLRRRGVLGVIELLPLVGGDEAVGGEAFPCFAGGGKRANDGGVRIGEAT